MPGKNNPTISPRSRPWLWVLAVFILQAAGWAAWITYAARHPVAEVPLVRAR